MAFDAKRYKVFKWLDRLSCKPYHEMRGIYARYGCLYATDGVILAKIEYPEFSKIGEYEWEHIAEFDAAGKHLEFPICEITAECERMRDRIFDDHLIHPAACHYYANQAFNAMRLDRALSPFKIYNLNPIIAFQDSKMQFSAHNSDVSMTVMLMGVKNV